MSDHNHDLAALLEACDEGDIEDIKVDEKLPKEL